MAEPSLEELLNELLKSKEAERCARKHREAIEHKIERYLEVPPSWCGSQTRHLHGYKVTCRREMRASIDAEKLRALAEKNGLQDTLKTCFHWKPELNKKAWDEAPEMVRSMFAPAVETKPGKVSVTVALDTEKGE